MEANMTVNTHNFEADTGKILNIVINSLYSDRDIFIRELLSNASDAIHKRKFIGQTTPNTLNSTQDEIFVDVDEKKKTIMIVDTGIGLTADDLMETLGTIARSGTSSFLDSFEEEADNKDAAKTLIGKFGVGFYSAFMVASKVEIFTKSFKDEPAAHWTCDGSPEFTLETHTKTDRGTEIVLHIAEDSLEFLEEFKYLTNLKDLIKISSNNIEEQITY